MKHEQEYAKAQELEKFYEKLIEEPDAEIIKHMNNAYTSLLAEYNKQGEDIMACVNEIAKIYVLHWGNTAQHKHVEWMIKEVEKIKAIVEGHQK